MTPRHTQDTKEETARYEAHAETPGFQVQQHGQHRKGTKWSPCESLRRDELVDLRRLICGCLHDETCLSSPRARGPQCPPGTAGAGHRHHPRFHHRGSTEFDHSTNVDPQLSVRNCSIMKVCFGTHGLSLCSCTRCVGRPESVLRPRETQRRTVQRWGCEQAQKSIKGAFVPDVASSQDCCPVHLVDAYLVKKMHLVQENFTAVACSWWMRTPKELPHLVAEGALPLPTVAAPSPSAT